MRTPSLSKGVEASARNKWGRSLILNHSGKTDVPSRSSKKLDFRYKLPPLIDAAKCEIILVATSFKKMTGTSHVLSFCGFRRETTFLAQVSPTQVGD